MKIYIKNNIKSILFSLLIAFVFCIFLVSTKCKTGNITVKVNQYESFIKLNDDKKEVTEEELLYNFFEENKDSIEFLSRTFGIDNEVLKYELKSTYKETDMLNKEDTDSFLIDYLFELEKDNKKMFNKKHIPCTDSKEYILSLIKYFTGIYKDVDFSIAAGIAEIESAYTASTMLKKNNIFGGMSNGNLIRYRNIEYGVLQYIKLLNDGYFKKGLTTIDAIGRVYNPMINENGKKVAKPTWVKNVTNAVSHYDDFNDVDASMINSLKNIAE